MRRFSLVIHGGAGEIGDPSRYAPSLSTVIEAGAALLDAGGSAIDAVEHCVARLEDDPLFNAGRGSVLNADGVVECDASIMDGNGLRAGAVAGVRGVKNPVRLARLVMEMSPHVLLIGAGAEAFGRETGAAFETMDYFIVEDRIAGLERARAAQGLALDHAKSGDAKLGTVGAVARDHAGNLAAATSTGGMTNKRWGRVGDSPIIGAGTYADNASCAVSCTGVGEDFLRTSLARVAAFYVERDGCDAERAATQAIAYLMKKVRGLGGLIIVDRDGNCARAHSTPGMISAMATADGITTQAT